MAKKNPLPPRRHRMKRPARLAAARRWLPTYLGKRVISAYARWFRVDLQCALTELRMLGVPLDLAYVSQIETTLREQARKRLRRGQDPPADDGYGVEWDDEFAFIAGFTEGGAPFGTTWWEVEHAPAPEREPGEDDVPLNEIAPECAPDGEYAGRSWDWTRPADDDEDDVPF